MIKKPELLRSSSYAVQFRQAVVYVPSRESYERGQPIELWYGCDELSDIIEDDGTTELGCKYLYKVSVKELGKVNESWMPHKFVKVDENTEAAHGTVSGIIVVRAANRVLGVKGKKEVAHSAVFSREEYRTLKDYFEGV